MSDPSAPRQRPRPKTAGARVDTTRGAHPQAAAPLVCQKTMMLHNQQPEQQQRPEMSNAVDGNVFPQTRGRIRQNNHGELPPVEETEVHLGFRRGSQAHAAQPRAHSRVVEVTGGQLKTAQAYRHYFQTNIHGGKVETVVIDQETNTAFVTFVKSEDAEKAVKHKHMIGEQIVNLRLLDGIQSAPSDLYLDKLLFTNVDVTREKGYLSLYFKSVADCEPIEDQILYGDRAGDVLVTFKQQPDILKTKENCRKQHFETREVAVRRVLKSKCVIVENLNPASTQDGVRNYFENPHRGGASVENITFSEDNKRCFVYFSSSEVAERIAQRDHRFDDSNLRVKVYMECLGPSAGGFDPRDFYFPQPITVGDVVKDADPHVRTFLKETKKVQRDWSKTFAAEHASISFGASEKDPITVSCTLVKTHPQFRLLADRWKTVVETLLKNMLGAVDMCKVKVMKDSWEDAENHIKGKFSVNGDKAMLIPIAAEGVIVVVGLIEKIGDIQKKLKKAVADIEKNNSKRTKKPVKLERHEISLLDKCNVFQELENKFRDFKITVNTAKGTVVFDGIRINIEQADRDVQVFLRKVREKQIAKLKAIQKTLLGRDTTCRSIDASLREKRLRAIWETDGKKVYLYAVGKRELTEAQKVIRKHLALETCHLSAESTELLKTDKFETTVKQKTAKQQERLIIDYKVADRMITIAGSTARKTKKQIEQYMFENTVYSETVSFSGSRQEIINKECGDKLNVIKTELQAYLVDISFGENGRTIAVKGTSQGLKQVRNRLEELGKKILCQVENLTQPDKIKFLYSKKCETNRKRIILTSRCVISLEEESADLQVLKSTRPPTPQPDDEDTPADEETDDEDEMQDDHSDEDTVVAGASKDADKDETLAKTSKHRKPPKELAETTEHKSPIEEPRSIQERIQVMKGDITNLPVQDGQVDVIVNAANNKLEHMGGLAQHIVEKGGKSIQTESRSIMSKRRSPLEDGDVVATGPGQLPCKEIFHAVGPRYRDGRSGEKERLALAVRNCLQLACERRHQGIALPAISTGIFGYPVEEATLVAMEAAKDFLKMRAADCSLQTVVFCDTVDEKVHHFHSAKEAIFPEAKPATGQTAFPPAPAVQGTAAPVPLTTVLSLSLVKGEIAKQQADVIVSSVSKDLVLTNGAVSKSVLNQAGPELQNEIKRNYPGNFQFGEVAITNGYGLRCRHVFHACLSSWSDASSAQLLHKVTTRCLTEASTRGYTSIAFPALGAVGLSFPKDVVAQTMLQAVQQFEQTNPSTSLREVRLVIYPTDQAVFQAFDQVRMQATADASPGGTTSPFQNAVWGGAATHNPVQPAVPLNAFPPAPAVQGMAAPVPLTTVLSLSLVKGEIAKQQADVIVSSVSKDLVLTTGTVSKSVLNQAGPELQNEIKKKYPGNLQFGEVAITNGYGLQCRHIFHVCLSSWSVNSSAQLLHKVTTRCLSEASTRGYTSIAFPALGAGALSFPKDVVAQTMLQAVQQFEQTNPSTSLREVRLVIYPTDQAVFSAFDAVMNQTGGSPPPHMPQGGPHPPLPVAHMGQPHHRADGEFNVSPHDRQTPLSPDKSEIELDGFSEDREVEECMLLGICFVVKQGLKEFESADAIVVYGDPKNPPNKPQDETDILVVNVATHKGKWDKGFSQCLKDAADRNHKRIALDSPVADKKQLLAKPFAEALFKAVTQVHEHLKNVQEIYVLFADHRDVNIFMMTMEKLGKAYNKSNPNAVKDKGAGDAWSQAKKPFEMSRRSATMPSTVTLYIYAAEQQHLKIFCEELENYVKETFSSEEMKQEQLTRMNEKFIQMIKKVARNKDVKLTINQKNGTIALYGFKDDVANARDDIRQIFDKATKEEHEKEKMEIYANIAQWSYLLEETDKGSKRVNYSRDQNSVIEKAFEAKDKMVKIQHNDGRKCIIDFNNMVEYPETDRQVEVLVLRRDNVQDKQEDYSTPEDWDPHAKNELVKLVRLSPTSTEFTSVRDHFRATIHNTKVSIEEITRIQNKALYQQYRVKKRQMETQNQDVPNLQNERVVWHGTAKDATDNINNHGFNRSYCGKNATIHGMGVYFAANSEYSARDTYSPADDQGKRYMYQSKVLVGVSCPSDQNMRFLPPRSGNVFYDSACDNVNSPGIIVIFNDTQAYPEYLITFKKA